MNYKYNTTNELNHFDFAEAVIGDIQMTNDMFRAVIDNVKILPENTCNRDIRTMRTNELMLRLDSAQIVCLVLEGYREYDADGNLKHTYEDVTVEPDEYKQKEDAPRPLFISQSVLYCGSVCTTPRVQSTDTTVPSVSRRVALGAATITGLSNVRPTVAEWLSVLASSLITAAACRI